MMIASISYFFLLTLPFVVQSIAICCDEFIFHRKRGLPFWERIGHPLDTLTTIFCISFCLWKPYSPLNLKIYIGLCLFSTLFITKDEWIHKDHCPGSEMWLHALLFVNHSLQLIALGLLWSKLNLDSDLRFIETFIWLQLITATLFCLYQIIYWNFIWKKKIQSITTSMNN